MQELVGLLKDVIPLVAMHVVLVIRALFTLPANPNTASASTADMIDLVLGTALMKNSVFMNTLLEFFARNAAGTPTTDMHWVVAQGIQLVMILMSNSGAASEVVREWTNGPR